MDTGGRERFIPGAPRCRTVSTSGGGEPVNAYVIAMDTAAVTLAALATGLSIAGRRGPRGPFPGLAGSLPYWRKAHAGQLPLTFIPGMRRGRIRVLHLTDHDTRSRGSDHGSARPPRPCGPGRVVSD